MELTVNQTHLQLIRGDITDLAVDAIVNAANTRLVLGGGVAGAIRRKGGPAIQAECDQKAPIAVGEAALTTGGKLKARYVIHAAGPRMGEGDEDRKLEDAVRSCLRIADAHNLTSLAFCAISTGIFGYPMDRCAAVMIETVIAWLKEKTTLKTVIVCLYDDTALSVFKDRLKQYM